MNKNTIQLDSHQLTQLEVALVVTSLVEATASSKKQVRLLNRSYRPALTSLAFAIIRLHGFVTVGALRNEAMGKPVEMIQARAKEIRREAADSRVSDNLRDMQLKAVLQHAA